MTIEHILGCAKLAVLIVEHAFDVALFHWLACMASVGYFVFDSLGGYAGGVK